MHRGGEYWIGPRLAENRSDVPKSNQARFENASTTFGRRTTEKSIEKQAFHRLFSIPNWMLKTTMRAYKMTSATDCWHIVVPLLLHSRHVRIARLIGVSHRLDAIARDAYPGLEPYRKLEYVCEMAERLMNTRLIRLFYHLASMPTADDIGAVLLSSSSECYWTMLASVGEDGRLWRFLDREWSMCASKHHVHAIAMSNVVNHPNWLRVLRVQHADGKLTQAQFTNMRLALYNRFLRTLDNITAFHNAFGVASV